MLIPFFYLLREGGMKTSISELLTLHEVSHEPLLSKTKRTSIALIGYSVRISKALMIPCPT